MAAAGTGLCPHAGGAGTGQRCRPPQSQFPANPRAAPRCFWFSRPLPSAGLLFVTSEALCSTEKMKA